MVAATRKARKSDYKKLVAAATAVVMNSRSGTLHNQSESGENEYVEVAFPYFVKFQKGFPKGYLIEKTLTSNVYQINAVRLLNWLHEKGYSKYSPKEVVAYTREYESIEKRIERMLDK